MDPVRRQMAERRERILAATREIIAAQGVDALTMRELARASRVTVPTLYNLIGGRDRVILEAVREQTERFVTGIAAANEADGAERVLAVADSCTGELLGMPRYYRTLLAWIFTADGAREVHREVAAALTRELRAGLRAMAAEGSLADWVDPAALAERLAAHLGFASLQWAGGQLDDAGFRAAARYEIALALRGASEDTRVRALLAPAIAEAQAGLRPPAPVRRRAGGGRP